MNEFNCMTEANHRHWQAVRAARKRQYRRKVTKASRRAVTLVALDAALAGATVLGVIVLVVCALAGG